jgi:hypothetical protein
MYSVMAGRGGGYAMILIDLLRDVTLLLQNCSGSQQIKITMKICFNI